MKLLTKAIEAKFKKAPLYSTDGKKGEVPVVAKFFTPWTNWTWYAVEGSPTCPECGAFDCTECGVEKTEYTFFGLVVGHEKELGYFNLKELESLRGPGGLTIERDRHFDGTLNKDTNEVKGL